MQLVGEPAGVKTGGMLSLVARELHVEALPADVPEHIEIDVTHMEVGDVLRLADVPAIDKVTLLDDPHETVIATVSVPRGFAELEEAEAAEAAEAAAEAAEGEEGAAEAGEDEAADARRELRLRGVAMRLFRRGEAASTLDLLVAGLGNPGPRHERDRHNVGWMVVDELARRCDASFKSKFNGRLGETRLGDQRIALLKPETYMNESGRSISAAARFFKVPTEDVLSSYMTTSTWSSGALQARAGGGLAGHNGLRSIAQALGGQDFLRLRIGVGRPGRGDPRDVADYVLSPFDPHEDRDGIVPRAADAVELSFARVSRRHSAASTDAIALCRPVDRPAGMLDSPV